MIGSFFVERTNANSAYVQGMNDGSGVSFVAEKLEDETVKFGIEADFIRTRDGANAVDLMAGTQGLGGFVFVAPVGQVKKIENY